MNQHHIWIIAIASKQRPAKKWVSRSGCGSTNQRSDSYHVFWRNAWKWTLWTLHQCKLVAYYDLYHFRSWQIKTACLARVNRQERDSKPWALAWFILRSALPLPRLRPATIPFYKKWWQEFDLAVCKAEAQSRKIYILARAVHFLLLVSLHFVIVHCSDAYTLCFCKQAWRSHPAPKKSAARTR